MLGWEEIIRQPVLTKLLDSTALACGIVEQKPVAAHVPNRHEADASGTLKTELNPAGLAASQQYTRLHRRSSRLEVIVRAKNVMNVALQRPHSVDLCRMNMHTWEGDESTGVSGVRLSKSANKFAFRRLEPHFHCFHWMYTQAIEDGETLTAELTGSGKVRGMAKKHL
jgi:hypothetical protein